MHRQECRLAVGCVLGLARGGNFAIFGASDCDDGVPDSNVAWVSCHVDLDDDGAREDVGNGEAHFRDLCNALVARIADFHHR